MTSNHNMVAIFRSGILNDDIGPISKSTFEVHTEVLLDASRHADFDHMRGVSANVMMGQTGTYGTGSFNLVMDIDAMKNMDAVDVRDQDMEKEIEVQVPVVLINQDSAPGTRGGAGVVTQGVYEVTILAKPLEIPSELEADCSILENLEMYVYAKDLNIPDGASLTSDEEAQIAWIQPPRVQEEVVEETGPVFIPVSYTHLTLPTSDLV